MHTIGEIQNLVYVVSSSVLYLFFFKRVFFILLEVSYSRRGEEHSFILKPATSVWNNLKVHDESPRFPKLQSGNSASKLSLSSNSLEKSNISSIDDQYAVMVSCRCNYTSKSFSPFICSVIPMKLRCWLVVLSIVLFLIKHQSYSLNNQRVGVHVHQGISWFLLHLRCQESLQDLVKEIPNLPFRSIYV